MAGVTGLVTAGEPLFGAASLLADGGLAGDSYLQLVLAAAFYPFGRSTGCQRRNVAPWSSRHSASSPYGLRWGSSAWPPAARTRSTAAAMSSPPEGSCTWGSAPSARKMVSGGLV